MLRRLVELKPRDVPFRVALRNTAAVVLPLAVGAATGHLGAGVGIAAGALNTMFLDQPGAYRLRLQRMLLTAIAAGISVFVGAVLGTHTWLTALAALLWGCGGGMLVALGPNAARAGLASMILLVITAANPLPAEQAWGAALLIVAGGLLQTLFALAAWPLQRYRPERHILATLYRQLAATARERPDSATAPSTTAALQEAQTLLLGAHRARGLAVQSFHVLIDLAERMRLELLALCDVHEQLAAAPAWCNIVDSRLDRAAFVLDAIATALEQGQPPREPAAPIEFPIDDTALPASRREQRLLRIARTRFNALAGQLRSALRNADFAGSRGEMVAEAAERQLPAALQPGNPLATLRANLSWNSVALRHAVRSGVCLSLAVLGERAAGLPHGYWIPMTTAIVLKPDFAGTFSFGLLRVAGTLAGLVLTTALVHFAFEGVIERLVLMTALCVGFRILATMHYGLGVACLTGLVVILLSFAGVAPGDTMAARGVATAIGSGFALLAYALWPSWERLQLKPTLATMVDAYRGYLAAVFDGEANSRDEARSAGRSARSNTEASMDRLRGEPRPDPALLELAEGVYANGNRLVRASLALEAVLQDAPGTKLDPRVHAFAAHVDSALAGIADGLREDRAAVVSGLRTRERELAGLLETEGAADPHGVGAALAYACDRITDSVDTLAHVLRQATRPPAAP